jgi:hypothetical protein
MKFLHSALFVAFTASTATAFVGPHVVSKHHHSSIMTTSPSSSNTALSMGWFSFLTGASSMSPYEPMTNAASEAQIRSLFYLWNDALATGDSRIVARRYAEDAVLLPTVSDEPRTDYDGIKDYFDNFLKLKPQGVIIDGKIKVGENWAKDAGIVSTQEIRSFFFGRIHDNCSNSRYWIC